MKRSDFTPAQIDEIYKKHSTKLHPNREYHLGINEPFYYTKFPNDRKKVVKTLISARDHFILNDYPDPIKPKTFKSIVKHGILETTEIL